MVEGFAGLAGLASCKKFLPLGNVLGFAVAPLPMFHHLTLPVLFVETYFRKVYRVQKPRHLDSW